VVSKGESLWGDGTEGLTPKVVLDGHSAMAQAQSPSELVRTPEDGGRKWKKKEVAANLCESVWTYKT